MNKTPQNWQWMPLAFNMIMFILFSFSFSLYNFNSCFRNKFHVFPWISYAMILQFLLKRSELQKRFVNSAHARAIFFRQGFTFKHSCVFCFWAHNKGHSLENEEVTSRSSGCPSLVIGSYTTRAHGIIVKQP